MPRIDLPGGRWADMRDTDDIRRRDRKAVVRAMDGVGGINVQAGTIPLSILGAAQETLIVRFVEGWNLTGDDGQPLPVTIESLDDLRDDLVRPLEQYVAPLLDRLLGADKGSEPDPTSEAGSSSPASTG